MSHDARNETGPVLLPGEVANAIITALRERHRGLNIVDRGGYLRVSVVGHCELTEEAVSHWLGRPFRLPADLERVMPSFRGRMAIERGTVTWTCHKTASQESTTWH